MEVEVENTHNWMYSFMPLKGEITDYIVLVGYCKFCDSSVSVNVPLNWTRENGRYRLGDAALIANLGVPKTGCIR